VIEGKKKLNKTNPKRQKKNLLKKGGEIREGGVVEKKRGEVWWGGSLVTMCEMLKIQGRKVEKERDS